jgi:hypothetical protein
MKRIVQQTYLDMKLTIFRTSLDFLLQTLSTPRVALAVLPAVQLSHETMGRH